MKKATSKRERKYGKKESEELESLKPKEPKKTIKKTKEPLELYKILIDRSSFTHAMSYDKCVEFINNRNKEAARVFRKPPLMSLVKA